MVMSSPSAILESKMSASSSITLHLYYLGSALSQASTSSVGGSSGMSGTIAIDPSSIAPCVESAACIPGA